MVKGEIGEGDVLTVDRRKGGDVAVIDKHGAAAVDGDVLHSLQQDANVFDLIALVESQRVGDVQLLLLRVVGVKVILSLWEVDGLVLALRKRLCGSQRIFYRFAGILHTGRVRVVVRHIDDI